MGNHSSSFREPITLLITYKASDFTEAGRIYQRTTPLHFITRLTAIAGLIVGGGALVLLALDFFVLSNFFGGVYHLGVFKVITQYLRWTVVALIPLSILLWFRPFRPMAIWMGFQLNKGDYQRPYQVTIDPQRISVKTSTTEGRQSWSAYSRVVESATLFVLVYGSWQYAVLPKREFLNPGTVDQIRTVLRELIGVYQQA